MINNITERSRKLIDDLNNGRIYIYYGAVTDVVLDLDKMIQSKESNSPYTVAILGCAATTLEHILVNIEYLSVEDVVKCLSDATTLIEMVV